MYTRRVMLLLFILALAWTGMRYPTAAAAPHPPETPAWTTFLPLVRQGPQFELQAGSPAYLSNYVNTAGCNWMGLAGQVFDRMGQPVLNLTVHVEGGGLSLDSVTGSEPAIAPGAYLLPLSDHVTTTLDTYRLELQDANQQRLSEVYVIPTQADCNRNLILVNFVQLY